MRDANYVLIMSVLTVFTANQIWRSAAKFLQTKQRVVTPIWKMDGAAMLLRLLKINGLLVLWTIKPIWRWLLFSLFLFVVLTLQKGSAGETRTLFPLSSMFRPAFSHMLYVGLNRGFWHMCKRVLPIKRRLQRRQMYFCILPNERMLLFELHGILYELLRRVLFCQ